MKWVCEKMKSEKRETKSKEHNIKTGAVILCRYGSKNKAGERS